MLEKESLVNTEELYIAPAVSVREGINSQYSEKEITASLPAHDW